MSEQKIEEIKKWFNPNDLSSFKPIPIKDLNGKIIMTDEQTRAYVAYNAGLYKIPLCWEEEELSWNLYQHYVNECLKLWILSVKDFHGRVLKPNDYILLWDKWCDDLQKRYGDF